MNSQQGGTLGEASDVELGNDSFSPVSKARIGRKFFKLDELASQQTTPSGQKSVAGPSTSAVEEESSLSLDGALLQILKDIKDEMSYNAYAQVSQMEEINRRLEDLEGRSRRSRSRSSALSSVKPSPSAKAPFSPSTPAPKGNPDRPEADLLEQALRKSRSERHSKGNLPEADEKDAWKSNPD